MFDRTYDETVAIEGFILRMIIYFVFQEFGSFRVPLSSAFRKILDKTSLLKFLPEL